MSYHLIFWKDSDPPTRSVIHDRDVKKNKNGYMAKWGSKWFPGNIVKSSNDRDFLENLEIDLDGNVIPPSRRESFPDLVIIEKRKAKKETKNTTKAALKVKMMATSSTQNSHSIFSDDSNDESENDMNSNKRTPWDMNKNQNEGAEVDENIEILSETETMESPKEQPDEQSELHVGSNYKKKGNGMIQLTKGYEVYVDKSELKYLKMNWKMKPKELTRRLMYLIIGKNNLRNMTPTGRMGFEVIPDDVKKAIFLYVNKKLDPSIQLSNQLYRRTLTNMCNTLRYTTNNPEKTTKK